LRLVHTTEPRIVQKDEILLIGSACLDLSRMNDPALARMNDRAFTLLPDCALSFRARE
jgi:hypothetical protein